MHIQELSVQLVVGGDGPSVAVNSEHVLWPGVHQGHHAVGEVPALRVGGLDGGDGVLLAALLPHVEVVVRPLEEGRFEVESSPDPGEGTPPGVAVVLEEVVGHVRHRLPALHAEGDLQLPGEVAAGLVQAGPGDGAGGEELRGPEDVLLVLSLAPAGPVVGAGEAVVVVGLGEGLAGAPGVRHGEGLEEEGEAQALALLSPAVEEGSDGKVQAVRGLGGVDHSEPVQAEHLTPGRVRHPGVELVQPGGLWLEAGGGEDDSTEIWEPSVD